MEVVEVAARNVDRAVMAMVDSQALEGAEAGRKAFLEELAMGHERSQLRNRWLAPAEETLGLSAGASVHECLR